MNAPLRVVLLAALLTVGAVPAAAEVSIPAGIDHGPWDQLTQRFVDPRGMVDYAAWKKDPQALKALDDYLARFAPRPTHEARGAEAAAGLINLYNAATIRLILDHYPTESIRKLDDPFDGERIRAAGKTVSLDDIEHKTLRKMPGDIAGWRVHAALVCAARSCPPLRRGAFVPQKLQEQLDERFREWLARPDLNSYHPEGSEGRVEVSKIFDWYGKDFRPIGGIKALLARFGPPEHRRWVTGDDVEVDFKDYRWGLNDQSDLGKGYERGLFDF